MLSFMSQQQKVNKTFKFRYLCPDNDDFCSIFTQTTFELLFSRTKLFALLSKDKKD